MSKPVALALAVVLAGGCGGPTAVEAVKVDSRVENGQTIARFDVTNPGAEPSNFVCGIGPGESQWDVVAKSEAPLEPGATGRYSITEPSLTVECRLTDNVEEASTIREASRVPRVDWTPSRPVAEDSENSLEISLEFDITNREADPLQLVCEVDFDIQYLSISDSSTVAIESDGPLPEGESETMFAEASFTVLAGSLVEYKADVAACTVIGQG